MGRWGVRGEVAGERLRSPAPLLYQARRRHQRRRRHVSGQGVMGELFVSLLLAPRLGQRRIIIPFCARLMMQLIVTPLRLFGETHGKLLRCHGRLGCRMCRPGGVQVLPTEMVVGAGYSSSSSRRRRRCHSRSPSSWR